MAKKARSSNPKKAAGKAVKKAVKKAAKKVSARSSKVASKAVAKPRGAARRKVTERGRVKNVTKGAKQKHVRKRPPAASAVLNAAVKAARQAEEKQAAQFDKAARLFQGRKFGQARPLLEKVSAGPNVGLSHRAGVYLQICAEQIARGKPRLRTAEENYNYAVQLINDRQLDDAESYLKKALKMDRKAAHMHYAHAILKILTGDVNGAFEALKTSIRFDPQNRILALRDPDFTAVTRDEPFKSLLAH